MFLKSDIFIVTMLTSACLAQEKWVWSDKTAKAVRDGGRVRYGVVEPQEEYRPPPVARPPPDLPPLIRPPPPNFPPPPIPSSRPESDPTKFDKCKCVHSFNCKSTGLLFGSCDTGKKYCCEKSVGTFGGERKDFYSDSREPEVLAGPGGPVDHIRNQGPERPGLGSYGRPHERPNIGIPPEYSRPQRPRYGN